MGDYSHIIIKTTQITIKQDIIVGMEKIKSSVTTFEVAKTPRSKLNSKRLHLALLLPC